MWTGSYKSRLTSTSLGDWGLLSAQIGSLEQREEGEDIRIKEVILDNLKSFKGRTRIELDAGFTAISGPNGSGKSNIIDALGFVCGVQSTGELRAGDLSDLIYKHDGSNHAEVEVVFQARDGEEFSIKRRVKRTEKDHYSYYYIDGRSCNLSDIRDLLYRAGMPMEGHNIVMQGDVTRVTETTPRRRREILDEVAGVSEFDSKVESAESELGTVGERIERVEIVLEEVRDRLDDLDEERRDALRYEELRSELEDLDTLKELSKYGDLETRVEDLGEALEERRSEKDELIEELAELKGELEEARDELDSLNRRVSEKGEKDLIELRREIESVRGDISMERDEKELLEEKVEDLRKEARRLFSRREELEDRAKERKSEAEEKELTVETLQSEVEEKDRGIEETRERLNALDDEFVELKEHASDLKAEISELKDERSDLLREQDRVLHSLRRKDDDRARVREEIEELEGDVEELEGRSSKLQKELEELKDRLEELQEEGYGIQRKKKYVREELDGVEEELREAQEELGQADAKVQAAREMEGKYSYPVRKVLEASRDKALPGVHGTVAELGKVSEEYSVALETAAGGRMQNVVVDTDGDGERAINFLKERDAGRCTFLPLNKISGRPVGRAARDALVEDGVVDLAIELVNFEDEYESVFRHVFGDTLVVEDLATARGLMGGLRMVTLDGSLVEKSGAMTGGSTGKRRFKFARDEEKRVKELSERIEELEGRRDELLEKVGSLESEEKENRSSIRESEERVGRVKRDLVEIEAKVEKRDEEREERREELKELEEERSEEQGRMKELEGELRQVNEAIDELGGELREVEEKMEESEAPELLERIDELESERSSLLERRREVQSSVDQKRMEVDLIQDELEEIEGRREELEERRSTLESRISSKEEGVRKLERRLDEKIGEEEELEDRLGELREERDEALTRVNDLEDEERDLGSKIERVDSRIDDLEEKHRKKREELDELREAVERHDVDPDDAPSPQELDERRSSIEEEMGRLEPVNMRAIEEYEAVEERETSLSQKLSTLVEERAAILERIEEIRSRKREVFMETFESINEKFGDIFSRVSPGGEAELVLEDEAEPFEGGLGVRARPGGKDVHSLDAMSGGEKSLTALSLIFAIQRHDPAPFYAFDEIDMFLDGANAERVAKMIENLSRDAQFIVVSLRQPTLERADRVVGVTMEDEESRVTGVDLGGRNCRR